MLFEESNINRDPTCTTWGRELQISFDEEWETIHEYAHKGSMNVAIQENSYKIETRWYRTPSLLHKFSPSIPNTCWRCGKAEGTMLHVWWDCDLIQPFWKKVHDIISQVTTYTLDYAPAQYLLHHTTLSKSAYYKSLAMHMVNAARLCVPTHWRSITPPTIREWFAKLSKIEEMEELIHISQERIQKFTTTWACWTHFKTSDYFQTVNS